MLMMIYNRVGGSREWVLSAAVETKAIPPQEVLALVIESATFNEWDAVKIEFEREEEPKGYTCADIEAAKEEFNRRCEEAAAPFLHGAAAAIVAAEAASRLAAAQGYEAEAAQDMTPAPEFR